MLHGLLVFWPSLTSAIIGLIAGIVAQTVAEGIAGYFHARGLRVGDTRKIFHLLIFTSAASLRVLVDPGAVVVFGLCIAGRVFYAVWLREQATLFRILARPGDAPYERLHVVTSMVATAVGGVAAQLLAGPLAAVPYLVAGWGDAVGEPVGIRWGRHRYRVPGWGTLKAYRSLEGSAAVWLASTVASFMALCWLSVPVTEACWMAVSVGTLAMLVEAVSPHGWDNLTLQVAVAIAARWLAG